MPTASDRPPRTVLGLQLALLVGVFALWWVLVTTDILPQFFFGDPVGVFGRVIR